MASSVVVKHLTRGLHKSMSIFDIFTDNVQKVLQRKKEISGGSPSLQTHHDAYVLVALYEHSAQFP